MLGEMLDTSPEQREAYFARIRSLSTAERIAMMDRLCRGVRTMAEAGIRHAHPEYSDAEVRRELTVRLYGEDVALRLHGPNVATRP